jgi:hypothetical protein
MNMVSAMFPSGFAIKLLTGSPAYHEGVFCLDRRPIYIDSNLSHEVHRATGDNKFQFPPRSFASRRNG